MGQVLKRHRVVLSHEHRCVLYSRYASLGCDRRIGHGGVHAGILFYEALPGLLLLHLVSLLDEALEKKMQDEA